MRKISVISILVLLVALFPSCKKDKLITNSSAKLAFTADSILFDTVFTSIGSTTKLFRVHNNNSGTINISSIRLARGSASFYRLNVDGVAGTPGQVFTNIEIAAHDSMYIFVKVNIDPNADPSVSPFIYRDSILFERGSVFIGELKISASGKLNNEIYVGAYGSGTQPIINGSIEINDWKFFRDNIWVADCAEGKRQRSGPSDDGPGSLHSRPA